MKPGDVVADRFEIVRLAGRGGMGTVWRARDRLEGGEVALKIMLATPTDEAQDDLDARFAREAALLAELHHPGIVHYVTHGATTDGDAFLAMEWIEGETLRARLGRGRLDPFEAVTLARRLGDALGAVHRHGVIHRDIKPMNILLPGGAIERAKLLDFGIARIGSSTDVTETGVLVGTWAYMSPEQAQAKRDIDARSDVFQLGAVLYECLTGHAPFRAQGGTAMLAKILLEEPPRVRELRADVPESVAAMVERAMSKSPAERFADGAALAVEAAAVLEETASGRSDRPSQKPRAIGQAEQRVVCVVIARRRADEDPTSTGRADPTRVELREEPLAAVAASRGGKLQILANGSALITFGAARSSASTDDAALAAACALALRAAAPELAIALGTGLGLTTAPVPVGDAIDRAAALLSDLPPGTIAVDPVTAGLLEPRFALERDSAEPSHVRLVAERDTGATRTLLGRPTRCVGRDRELATLEALFLECAAEPIARIALLTGPPGIGKSRVRYELQRRLADRGTVVETLIARGDPTRARSPFGLAADALRRAAGILEGDPLDIRREKLEARLARVLPEGDGRDRALMFLAEMIRAPYESSAHPLLAAARADAFAMGDAIRAAWEEWIAAECRVHSLLLVLEDLHWGDTPTVRLIDATLRNLPEIPLLVLALGRPEVHETFPGLWAERDVQTVALGPLTRSAAEKLVRQTLGDGVPPETAALVVQRAEGNAFYLEELIRAVAEGSPTLPDSVVGMVQARLASLAPEARRVLRAASVFGATFWSGGVAALLGGEVARPLVDEQLASLAARELVSRRHDTAFPGESEHVFRHALVREGAYAMLTGDDRRVGHALAGDWLERSGSTQAVELAEHFERGGLARRAAEWWARASEEALAASDYLEAIARAERAIAGGVDGGRRVAMLLVQTDAHRCRGQSRDAIGTGMEALQVVERHTADWLRLAGEVIAASGFLGEYDRVLPLVAEVRETRTADDEDRAAKVVALARASAQLWQSGNDTLAREVLADVEALMAEIAEPPPLAVGWVEVARGLTGLHAGDAAMHLRQEELALAAFERGGYERLATMRRNNIGAAYCELGELGRAEVALRQALAASERLGLQGGIAYALQNLAKVLLRRGQLREGRDIAARSITIGVKLGNPRIEGTTRAYLAEILRGLGEWEQAEREARIAFDLLDRANPSLGIYATGVLIEILIARGRLAEAIPLAESAEQYLAAGGSIEEGETMVRRVVAETLEARG